MIEINLLPKELKRKKIEIPEISFLPIIAVVVGAIILVHVLFGFAVAMKEKTLKRLEKKWANIQPDKEDADKVIVELTAMRKKIETIDRLIENRLSWARKLSDLSDAMIPGVWLNRLWIERKAGGKETLHLNGSVIVTGGEETAAVGKFMWSLKNNPAFFADFREIESAYMQQSKLKDVEVMDFELVSYFKK